jgi:hypothetical protein
LTKVEWTAAAAATEEIAIAIATPAAAAKQFDSRIRVEKDQRVAECEWMNIGTSWMDAGHQIFAFLFDG